MEAFISVVCGLTIVAPVYLMLAAVDVGIVDVVGNVVYETCDDDGYVLMIV